VRRVGGVGEDCAYPSVRVWLCIGCFSITHLFCPNPNFLNSNLSLQPPAPALELHIRRQLSAAAARMRMATALTARVDSGAVGWDGAAAAASPRRFADSIEVRRGGAAACAG
jgi:hypothetical protein